MRAARETTDLAVAQRILRLDRRAHGAALRLARGRAWTARAALAAPFRAAREALAAVRRYGRPTSEDAGVSTARQLAWMWWLALRYRYGSETVYRFRLFSRGRAWPVPPFVQPETAGLLYRVIARCVDPDAARTLADKRRFAAWCDAQGIRTPRMLLEFDGGSVTRRHIAGDETPSHDLFAKWATQYGGASTRCWRWNDGSFTDDDGREATFADVVATLAEQSREGAVVLQPRLVNHAAIRRLSPHALSTIRIMTLRRPGGRPRLLAAVLRMATGSATVDNVTQGGWVSAVDLDTGTLGVARRYDDVHRTFERETHPDTGAPIRGFEIPCWREAADLALDAHERLGRIPCVGWDVAVLPDGPVLVEGNWNPGTKFVQVATQTPLLTSEFARTYVAWLDDDACRLDDATLAAHMRWSPT